MRKLILMATMLALAVMATAPAMAQGILSPGPETTTSDAPLEKSPEPALEKILPPLSEEGPPEEAPAPLPEAPAPPPAVVDDVAEDTSAGQDAETEADSVLDTGDTGSGDSGNDNSESKQDAALEDTGDDAKENVGPAAKDSGDEKAADGDGKAKGNDKDADEKGSGKDDDEIEQDSDQDADSGDADQDIDIINTGDNVNLCIGIIQAVNTGNIQDSDQIAQEDSEAEEVELEDGSTISVTPQLIVDCRQIIYQIVTGEDSDGSKDKVSKTGASKLAKTKIDLKSTYFRNSAGSGGAQQVRTGGTGTRVISNRSDARAAQQANASRRALPRTGGVPVGYAAILGLSVGAPLVGGGLLLRRISR